MPVVNCAAAAYLAPVVALCPTPGWEMFDGTFGGTLEVFCPFYGGRKLLFICPIA
jgi:hypothetical protein